MFSWTKRSKRSFHAENLKRQQKPYIAPGRGWYHIYTFRLGRPEELTGALTFLLDEEAASFVTGVVIPIDGGFSAFSGV